MFGGHVRRRWLLSLVASLLLGVSFPVVGVSATSTTSNRTLIQLVEDQEAPQKTRVYPKTGELTSLVGSFLGTWLVCGVVLQYWQRRRSHEKD